MSAIIRHVSSWKMGRPSTRVSRATQFNHKSLSLRGCNVKAAGEGDGAGNLDSEFTSFGTIPVQLSATFVINHPGPQITKFNNGTCC
jgi:hypothetical protein